MKTYSINIYHNGGVPTMSHIKGPAYNVEVSEEVYYRLVNMGVQISLNSINELATHIEYKDEDVRTEQYDTGLRVSEINMRDEPLELPVNTDAPDQPALLAHEIWGGHLVIKTEDELKEMSTVNLNVELMTRFGIKVSGKPTKVSLIKKYLKAQEELIEKNTKVEEEVVEKEPTSDQ